MKSRSPLGVVGKVFIALGVGFLGVGAYFIVDTHRFVGNAELAPGVVTHLKWRSNNKGSSAYPVVVFEVDGRKVEIQSNVGSSPPSFHVGEEVTVYYPPGQPDKGRIGTWVQLYFLGGLFALLGGVFTILGLVLYAVPAWQRRRRQRALDSGHHVTAKVKEIIFKKHTRYNGKSPWVLVAEYMEDLSGTPLRFTSHYLWTDPAPQYPVGSDVTIYYLPHRPNVHAFQLDRLPASS